MKIEEKLDTLAELAGLTIEKQDREKLVKDMESILEYVEQIQSIKSDTTEYKRDEIKATQCREDKVVETTEQEKQAVLDAFPNKTSGNLLEAHAVIDQDI